MTDAPSGWRLERAMAALMETRDRLLREYPDMADDATLFADMLEGESGNEFDVIDRVIRASIEADALAQAAKQRRAEIAERQARFECRRDNLRAMAFSALEALQIRKRETADFTAYIRSGSPSVVVFDETALPQTYWRVTREPDKVHIREALKSGYLVEGATLSNSPEYLALKVK